MTDGAAAPLTFDGGVSSPAPSPFDAVLLVHPVSDHAVAGLHLVERAAFTLVRAGARRLLCVGARPPCPLRLPDVPIAWVAADDAVALDSWLTSATSVVVGMDAAVVTDRDTVAALAVDPRAGLLATHGLARLWRAPRERIPATLQGTPTDATAWTPPPGALLLPAADAAAREVAARALFSRLGRAGDGWFTRLVDRRISRALTRVLLPTGVTPNQVTLASIAAGILAGGLFATGSHAAAVAGSLLFLASTIVDGCDGELARLTFRESRFGALLDVVGDNVVHVFLFGGIAVGLYRRGHDPRLAIAGWLLVLGVVAAMIAVYACVVRREPTRRQRALFEAFASREFAYLLVALTLAGKLAWFLWAAAAGTWAFAVALVALRRRPSERVCETGDQ